MKKLNSTEIAKLAGVSRSTVSRVVNGYSNVPKSTRDRVMKIINENEYYPLLSGQLLAGKRTGTIGLFWVSSGTIAGDMLCSEYFAHVTESAAELGYLVLTCIVKNLTDQENIEWIKRVFMQGRVDAGIFIGARNNEPFVEIKTWSTDASFRETEDRVALRMKEGCDVVEMETAAYFAVAEHKKLDVGQLLFAGDVVVKSGWDFRNWHTKTDMREKLLNLSVKIVLEM